MLFPDFLPAPVAVPQKGPISLRQGTPLSRARSKRILIMKLDFLEVPRESQSGLSWKDDGPRSMLFDSMVRFFPRPQRGWKAANAQPPDFE